MNYNDFPVYFLCFFFQIVQKVRRAVTCALCSAYLRLFGKDFDIDGENARLLINDFSDLCHVAGKKVAVCLYDDACSIAADNRNTFFKPLCANERFNVGLLFDLQGNAGDIRKCLSLGFLLRILV